MDSRKGIGSSRLTRIIAAGLLLFASVAFTADTQQRKFYPDDPISKEPNSFDASKANERDISLLYDLALNLFAVDRRPVLVRAQSINTIDEVPDSDWFTNRILAKPFSVEDAVRGPDSGSGPAPGKMVAIGAKTAGVAPGFALKDSAGKTWFVQFDASGTPEAASAAAVVATKFFYALGYFQAENYISTLDLSKLEIDPRATVETPSGRIRPMRRSDIDRVLSRASRRHDGTYRMMASLAIPGRILGGFKYSGTRTDDPNDIIPHQHRRELRALKVFGAWTNLVDMKAGNTLDTVITENGRGVIRHYLQDVGSTFGTAALAPREWDEGYEYLYEGDKLWKRLKTFGFYIQPWQTIPYQEHQSIGRFEGDHFDPESWCSRVPTAAVLNARADDNFWAARRVMAFSDEMIRAIVRTGQFSDPAAGKYLADVMIKRRDKIGRAYLPAVNPVVNIAMDALGTMTFENAAVDAGFAEAPRGGYEARWYSFDNNSSSTSPIGLTASQPKSTRIPAPNNLPSANGSFIKVDIVAMDPPNPSWKTPVQTYFQKVQGGWKLVGLIRLPD
jgi:hypothetical protein